MKQYRIYVGSHSEADSIAHFNAVSEQARKYFPDATLTLGHGLWHSVTEPVVIIEVLTEQSRHAIDWLAALLRNDFKQDSVLVTETNVEFRLV